MVYTLEKLRNVYLKLGEKEILLKLERLLLIALHLQFDFLNKANLIVKTFNLLYSAIPPSAGNHSQAECNRYMQNINFKSDIIYIDIF